jgi:hypothetical protein
MLVSMSAASVLMVGMGSAVFLSSQAFNASDMPPAKRVDAAQVQKQILDDLRYASSFSERSANAVTFVVPDRTGDGLPDTLRYAWSGAGTPLTFALNSGTAQTLIPSVENFSLNFRTQTLNAPVIPDDEGTLATILFVSAGEVVSIEQTFLEELTGAGQQEYVALTTTELAREAILESAGYSITAIPDDASDELVAAALAATDAVYVSGEANNSALSPLYFETTLGVVSECDDAVEDFGFCKNAKSVDHSTLHIFTSEHYITSDFTEGPLLISNSTIPLFQMDGDRSPDLQSLAKDYDRVGHAMLALNANAEHVVSGIVPARRVQLPFGFDSFDPSDLTDEGRLLITRSIDWVLGNGDDGTPNLNATSVNFGYENKFDPPKWGFDRRQIATMVDLAEGGTLKSLTVYLSYWTADARVAIYSDSNGEPDVLIAQSELLQSDRRGSWVKFPMPDTELAAGTYWLAIGLSHYDQEIFRDVAPGGKIRLRNHDAARRGFIDTWGSSSFAKDGSGVSIYGTVEVLK